MEKSRLRSGAAALALAGALSYGCERAEEPAPTPAGPAETPAATELPPAAEPTVPPAPPPPGVESPEAAPGLERTGEESDSPPAATLLGIVLAEGRPDAAVIEHGGEQDIFRTGDSVFDLGRLERIDRSSVRIRGASKPLELTITATPTEEEAPPAEVQILEEAPADASEPRPIERPIARNEARTALSNLTPLLEKAGAERVAVGGKHGVLLTKVDAESFFAKLGLKSGDVLQRINDVALEDPDEVPNLASAAAGKQLMVSFWRQGLGLTLSRDLK